MKKIITLVTVSTFLFTNIVVSAYSDNTNDCVDRLTGLILSKDTFSITEINELFNESITSFCLKTYTDRVYDESSGYSTETNTIIKLADDYVEDFFISSIVLKHLLNGIAESMFSEELFSFSFKNTILTTINDFDKILADKKDFYISDIQYASDFNTVVTNIAEDDINNINNEFDDWTTFKNVVSGALDDSYICKNDFWDNYSDQCHCFDGYYFDQSSVSCVTGEEPIQEQPPAVEQTTTTTPIPEQVFSDVPVNNAFFDAIGYLVDNNIVSGYGDGTYKPYNAINRAEFTKIVVGAIAPNVSGSNCFPDVRDEWFAPYVCYAKEHRIIEGYSDDTFKPNQNINLAESLKIVLLALEVDLSTNQGTAWFDVYVNTANRDNLLANINPDVGHNVSRGEMAELIYSIKQ
ncbi:MAG: S-layer homology domain-containing protein [Candidatus Margulisbacteria bacterium]|nr:S-layer homology domain-containing protein [Candidatus Margulisiibacteriota bacterium]